MERLATPVVRSKSAEEWGRFVLFEGCTMSRRMVGSRFATRYILDKYGFDYIIMEREKCCGAPVMRSGGEEDSIALREYNLDNVVKCGCYGVVTGCPGCGSQLKSEEAEERGIEVYHLVELLYTLAVNGELYQEGHMRDIPELKITAHLPCHLYRGMRIDAKLIQEKVVGSFPNLEYIEIRDADKCCGAGGGVRASQKELSYTIRSRKLRNIHRSGADVVLAACPFCELQIDEGLRGDEHYTARAITPQSFIAMMFRDIDKEVSQL